jgi:hypothetical protein
MIFDHFVGPRQYLTALHLPASVDDSAWATTRHGALYVTDGTDGTVDVVSGTYEHRHLHLRAAHRFRAPHRGHDLHPLTRCGTLLT